MSDYTDMIGEGILDEDGEYIPQPGDEGYEDDQDLDDEEEDDG